jgi:excisionase family DNA binding protein
VIPQWSWLFPTGLSASDIARGSILCVFAYWGWDACLPTSEETKDPHKNPGTAAVLATILVLGTYVLVSYAIQAFAGFGTTGIGLNNPQNANDTRVNRRRYITVAEAAEHLQISDRTVRRLIRDGELNGYRMGSSLRVIRVDLNEIDDQLMRPMNEPPRRRKPRTS